MADVHEVECPDVIGRVSGLGECVSALIEEFPEGWEESLRAGLKTALQNTSAPDEIIVEHNISL